MKVTAFNGSARKDGNTTALIRTVFGSLERRGIETELVNLAGKNVRGCTACYRCFDRSNRHCAVGDEKGDSFVNDCIEKMLASDGIILGSPTYFADLSPELKALIDRSGMVARANGDMFKRKVGAAVVAVRRAGAIHAFDSINHFFTIGQMIIPGSSYWNVGRGAEKGDVAADEEGLGTMRQLGRNMSWLLKKLHS